MGSGKSTTSDAKYGSFTELKFIKYEKIMHCLYWAYIRARKNSLSKEH
jgi:hypothetical protein